MLFHILFKNEIYIKAQVQIIQIIQIWLPMKNNRWGKNHIHDNMKGENLKEGHMTTNCRILLLHFFSLSSKTNSCQDKGDWTQSLPSGESLTLITIRDTDNQTLFAELEITAPDRNQGYF